jgi:type I restriction enzyme S subunit
MESRWPRRPLDSLVNPDAPITYGVVKPGDPDPDGVLFIRSGDIAGGKILIDNLRTISKRVSTQYSRTLLRGGEILVSLVGNPGQTAIVPDSLRGANIARQVGLVRITLEADPRYIRYFLCSPEGQRAMGAYTMGSVQQVINLRDLKRVEIPTPPLRDQYAIASILGALDDKIELNRKMSATLEAIARALFKSWFVDFDPVRAKAEGRDPGLPPEIAALFPDSFQNSELGEIPKGWSIERIGSIADASRTAINPAGCPNEIFYHYSIPAFDASRLPVKEAGRAIKSNKFLVRRDSVLVSRLNPITPRIWRPDVSGALRSICSTEFAVMIPRALPREWLYCLFSSSDFCELLATMVTGTSGSHQRVKPESMKAMQVVAPLKSIAEQFTAIVAPVLARATHCLNESQTLAALRDALLPKLISGEIRVTDAERLVEKSA